MPRIPIIMPQLGESIAEATVVSIPFQVGDTIESDQDVLEVETNKATMGVTPPCGGRIAEWPGGPAEISRWWSESASGNHRITPITKDAPRRGAGTTRAIGIPSPLPGRDRFIPGSGGSRSQTRFTTG